MLEEMLLHTADKSAIRAHGASALGAFEVKMVAVTARIAVGGARPRLVYEFADASVRGKAVETAVDGGF